jgi:hypothetical protein
MVAELGSHVLHMCPIQWQDQYNMNKKGMTPMDIHLLLTSLEVVECICTYEKGKPESSKKSSNKGKKGKKCPGTDSTARVLKKVHFEKNCDLCKKHRGLIGARVPCTILVIVAGLRRMERRSPISVFRAAKKGGKKANPVNQNFAQLTKKIEKSLVRKDKSAITRIAIPTPNRELGQVALRK